jgi:hypothetical protein
MSILVVGDGPRDQVALPVVVCRILGKETETRYDDWHLVRVYRQKGTIYARKAKYLTRRAQADGFVSLAIVVDTDKTPPRDKLRALRQGRDEDRLDHPPFPTASGEANPHFDVWLLDDAVAVRGALQLPADFSVENAVRAVYPKDTLSKLMEQSQIGSRQVSDVLGEIARRLVPERCVHGKQTGFSSFAEDVQDEIRPTISR